MRASWYPYFDKDEEDGVNCQCGRCLFLTKEELTPPKTIVVCPECGAKITYVTGLNPGIGELRNSFMKYL